MEKRYAEDFKKGDIFDLGEYAFSEDEIIDFAKKYDPFPFHINKDAAEKNCIWRYYIKWMADSSYLAWNDA